MTNRVLTRREVLVRGGMLAGAAAVARPGGAVPLLKEHAYAAAGSLPAPEASQAAAADERFVYAIADAVVAKYDRGTGERLEVSKGRRST